MSVASFQGHRPTSCHLQYVFFMQLKMVQAWNINAGQYMAELTEFVSSHTAQLVTAVEKHYKVS